MNQRLTSDTEKAKQRTTGPRHKINANDFSAAEELLRTAALVLVPDDQGQRQAFEQLMPHLYVLRNKGCSFEQLTKLLTDIGFKLQPSTVRTYYSELLAARLDLCQARMNEQIAIMAALRSENAGADIGAVAGRVQAAMAAQRNASAHRVNSLLGIPPAGLPAPSGPAPAIVQAPAAPRIAPPRALPPPSPPAPSSDHFGMLSVKPTSPGGNGQPEGFFTLDHEPQTATAPVAAVASPAVAQIIEPQQQAPRAPAAPITPGDANAAKKAVKLQAGVTPLKPRANVPAEVYEPGLLEHPAIPGLVLTLEERLYGAALEYLDLDGGELHTETPEQKRFRVTWRKVVPMTDTRTGESFTQMDTTLFTQGNKG